MKQRSYWIASTQLDHISNIVEVAVWCINRKHIVYAYTLYQSIALLLTAGINYYAFSVVSQLQDFFKVISTIQFQYGGYFVENSHSDANQNERRFSGEREPKEIYRTIIRIRGTLTQLILCAYTKNGAVRLYKNVKRAILQSEPKIFKDTCIRLMAHSFCL